MNFKMFRLIIINFFIILYSAQSHSELRIDITQGNTEPIPVALVPFETKIAKKLQFHLISQKLYQIIFNDLVFFLCFQKNFFD